MNLKGKIVILLFIALSFTLSIKAQTLYWVGGSGNFNDSKHWSLSSGGSSANVIPNTNNNVIFDDNSGISSSFLVNFVGVNQVNSFYVKNNYSTIHFTGTKFSVLDIGGDFVLNTHITPSFSTKLNFNSLNIETNFINFSGNLLSSDVEFNGGNYKMLGVKVSDDNSITFNKGKFIIDHSSITAGNIIAKSNLVLFDYTSTIFTAKNKLEIDENVLFKGDGLKIIGQKNNPNLFKLNSSVSQKSSTQLLQMSNMVCTITYSFTNASCNNACDGTITINFAPGCITGPYNLTFNSSATCLPPSVSSVNPPTFTLGAICASLCAGQLVDIIVDDGSFVTSLNGQSLPQNPTPINANFSTITAPSCFGVCNGSVTISAFGGSSPYTISVDPNTGPVFTNVLAFSPISVTGLCSGPHTYSVVDNKGCVKTFTSNIPNVLPLNTNSVLVNASCNPACNGSLNISPTGGTAGYTVSFTPGGTFTVPALGTVSSSGLCAGPISATLTDVKGCTLTTSGTITQPPAITVTPTQTNVTCFGLCTGAASVAVSGGVSPYSYTWSPGPGNTPGITNICASTQTVTISDNSLCVRQQTFLITQPLAITLTPSITNVSCNGVCNASASVSASGGTGPITFTWVAVGPSTISTTSVIAGQCAGTYTIFARDGNLCTTSTTIAITQPPALTLTAITQSIVCFGQCTGASTAVVIGGNGGPFSYTWSPGIITGQGTANASNLCFGTYSLAVTDASNCPVNTTLSITQPSSITPNVTTTTITCNGFCNGSINTAPIGGIGPYTFTLVTPFATTLTSAPPYTALCAGIYTLLIKDQSSCVQSQTVNVAQPNPFVASVSSTSLNCFNVCNGSLAGSVLGGTPGYTLSWSTSTSTVPGGIISSLCAGTYTFLAVDFNGCTTSSVVVLGQPPQITATINVTNPLCNTSCNGVANAGIGGGTPGYTLNWSNGFSSNPNTGLCAGVYTLIVTDNNGCTSPFTTTLTAPPAITITINTSTTSCAGSCDGSATVIATGGNPGFTYQFNTLPFPTTNTTGILSGLCAGGLIANVTDANGCSQSQPFTIVQPIALSIAVTGIQTSCNACTGAGTVTASNGTPTYAVVWTNSLSATVSSNSVATTLCPGNYTATVTDSKGCTATTSLNIAQTVSLTVSADGLPIQCFGACTASATATPTGGTGPYSYTWAVSSQTTQTAVNLCAGIYTVTAADVLGCSNTATIAFINPPNIIVAPTQTNVTCNGSCNGAINSNVSGGTGLLTYSWSPGGQTTANLTNLCAGNYTLLVTDANNCNRTQTFVITQSPSITVTFTTTNPSACVVNNGSICATASGGSGAGYTFTWSPGGGVGINTSCYSLLPAGAYSLVVMDGAGCTRTVSALLTNPTGPTLTVNSQSIACFGANTGVISVTATGVPVFGFTWTPIVGFVTVGNTSTANSLLTGTYVISASDGNGCITSQSIAVIQASSLTVTSALTNVKCNSACNGSITLVTSGATPGYTYSWLPAPSITVGQGTGTVSSLCAGNYSVNITDANSCLRTVTFAIAQPAALTLTTTSSNVKCFGSCNGSITATASGGSPPLNYTWTPTGPFLGAASPTVINLCPAVYTVIVTDASLCVSSQTVQITQPPALTSTLNLINATCSSSCNAVATNTVVGGTPTYTFSWSSSPATTSTLGNLCAGNYTATVTDANGCVSANGFTVVAPAPFNGTLTPTNPLCNATCNGSITTLLSGAQGTVNFVWLPTGSGQNPTGLCPNNYTLTATDAAGCQLFGTAILTQPLALLANVTSTNPSCNGNCNGIAISTPANAQGAVNYTWTPLAPNSATINALCAGNYSVLIQDGNGCQDVQTFTLTNPPILNVNPSISPAACGLNNGSITVVVVGGTPSYSYTWGPPIVSTNSAVTGLAAGVYTVVVTDSKNCTNTITIPLSNSNGPSSAPIVSNSVLCNGQCTGAASINVGSVLGGTPGYTVSWVSPPSTTSINPQTNLCAGVYTAQVSDLNACLLFTAVTISQPAPINILPNVGLPSCNGVCNGSISLNPSGGVGPFNYTWTPVAPNSATLLNACAGNYTINILDNNLCPSTQTLNLPSILNMLSTIASTNNTCFANCNGISNLTSLSGGLPPYSLNWNTGQTTNSITSLCNGIYSLTVTDANMCFNTFTSTITSPAQITSTNAVISPSCNLCNGSSTITAFGGTAPFTYSWTSGATGTNASSLCAGLYQVLVTDNNNCTQIQNVIISNSSGITAAVFSNVNEQCAGTCNGSSTVNPIGGTAPITYSWTSPASTNSNVAGLCAGIYFVQMTDAQGCIRTASTTINAAVSITLTPNIIQPGCGLTNGTINVVATGGSPTYSFSWVPTPSGTATLANIGVGNYSVTVTDNNGCIKNQAFAISNANGPVVTFTQSNISCFNACTGSITALGTTTSTPVTYSWSTGSTLPTITGICKGIITLTVTAANGCKTVTSFTITDNPDLQLTLSNIQQPRCNGDCNGAVTLVPSGGTLPYTFTWSPSGNTNPLTALCSNTYIATITDNKGCIKTESVIINNPPLIALTSTVNNSSCSTAADGGASVTVSGGTPAFNFTWTSSSSSFTSNSQNINNVLAGTYSLSLIDNGGCVKTTTVQIVPTITISANAGNNATVCPTGSVVLTGTNSIGAANYNWFLLPNTTTTVATTPTLVVPNASGTSTYVLQAISSASTCFDFDTVVVNIFPLPLVDAGPSYTIPVFSTVTIGGSPTSPTGLTFTWSPPFNLDNGNIPNPAASNTINTTYTVTTTDANGCIASDTMHVFLYPQIMIPNGFSPNGDSKNDKWIIDLIEQFPDNTVEVYNRWGEQLFYSKGYTVPFDGRYKGKDLPVGTYYYIINLNHPAYTTPYTGPLTIFR